MSLTGRLVQRAPRPWLGSGVPLGVLIAGVVFSVIVIAALAPSWLSSLDPLDTDPRGALEPPSASHLFGTDQSGRDVFSRVVFGARYSLAVGFGATAIAVLVGVAIGLAAVLGPRLLRGFLGRSIDVLMAFPEFLLALLVIAVLGTGEASIPVAVALAALPAYARVARSETLVVAQAGYIRSARALGVSPAVLLIRHVLPNIVGPIRVMATIGIGTAIVTASGLSFLGLGAQPPTPEWGVILSEGRNFLATAWWISVFPGLSITATVVSVSVIGRYLRLRGEGRES